MNHCISCILSILLFGCTEEVIVDNGREEQTDSEYMNPYAIHREEYNCSKSPDERKALVDPSFSYEEKGFIASGWSEWQDVLGSLYPIHLSFPETISQDFEPCTIKILKHHFIASLHSRDSDKDITTWGGWTWGWADNNKYPQSYRIWLSDHLRGNVLQSITMHEIGHMLFLPHNTMEDSIMHSPPTARHLSDYDKMSVLNLWKR